MNKESLIELSAIAGKIAIEHTKLHPIAKTTINWTIDQVAEYLKKELLSDIEKIRITAKKFDVDKVVAIHLGFLNGKELVAFRVYGKRSEDFIKAIGMQAIPLKNQNHLFNDINEAEKNFGVLIYQK